MRELADEKARAERARLRFEARNERVRRERLERDEQLAAQKREAQKAGPDAVKDMVERAKQARDKQDEDG